MSWNLEDHILDHAALVSNNLPSYFNLADDKNIHFTFSVDKSQLIINHNCKSQKDIDIVMSKFFEDIKEYEYIFYESQGSKKPKRKMSLDFSHMLFAYHNTDSDSINSKNYEVEPHFHLLIPQKLKNKYEKSTKVGLGYLNLRRMINEVALKHNLTFNFNENVSNDTDLITKKQATKFTWFNKRVDDQHFLNAVQSGQVNKYIQEFIKHYKRTENIQYYIKGMTDFKQRLLRQNIDFFYDGKNLKSEDFPLFFNEDQIKSLDIINSGNIKDIKELIKIRENKIARAFIEYNFGFNNVVTKELEQRGNVFKKIDLDFTDINIDINKKMTSKDSSNEKYKKSLAFNVKEDVTKILKVVKNDKHFLELMQYLGYENIKFKAKNVEGKRERVGFTFTNNNENYTVYLNSLDLNYKNLTTAYKNNVDIKASTIQTELSNYKAKINDYIPLKQKTYNNKIFYTIYKIEPNMSLENYYINKLDNEVEFKHKYKDLTIKDKEKSIIATKSRDTILLKEDVTEQVKLMLELYEARGLKLGNISVTASKEIEDETIKQILEKIENMSHQDRNEFLTKLNYSEQEKQAINSYYEKLNKSKATDNITEEPKDEGLIDCSDENLKEAGDNLLEFLEEDKMKHRLQLN